MIASKKGRPHDIGGVPASTHSTFQLEPSIAPAEAYRLAQPEASHVSRLSQFMGGLEAPAVMVKILVVGVAQRDRLVPVQRLPGVVAELG